MRIVYTCAQVNAKGGSVRISNLIAYVGLFIIVVFFVAANISQNPLFHLGDVIGFCIFGIPTVSEWIIKKFIRKPAD